MTKEQPGTWGKNKSTKDDGLRVGMRESPGCTLHSSASFASIPACITGMRAEVRPLQLHPQSTQSAPCKGWRALQGPWSRSWKGTSTPFPSPPTRLPHPSLLSAWARREGSPPCAVPAPRAKPLGTRKPLQTMPWSLGIIDGVFTTSKRPVPGQTVKGNTSGPLG